MKDALIHDLQAGKFGPPALEHGAKKAWQTGFDEFLAIDPEANELLLVTGERLHNVPDDLVQELREWLGGIRCEQSQE